MFLIFFSSVLALFISSAKVGSRKYFRYFMAAFRTASCFCSLILKDCKILVVVCAYLLRRGSGVMLLIASRSSLTTIAMRRKCVQATSISEGRAKLLFYSLSASLHFDIISNLNLNSGFKFWSELKFTHFVNFIYICWTHCTCACT